jgi:hypothetical protein
MVVRRERAMKIVRQSDNEFAFSESFDGSGARVDSLAFVPVDGGAPLWWVVADEYSDTWTTSTLVEVAGDAAEVARAQFTTFQSTATGQTLSAVRYGEVPKGYRQMTPEHGRAPNLERGVRYILHVVGNGFDSVEFKF